MSQCNRTEYEEPIYRTNQNSKDTLLTIFNFSLRANDAALIFHWLLIKKINEQRSLSKYEQKNEKNNRRFCLMRFNFFLFQLNKFDYFEFCYFY